MLVTVAAPSVAGAASADDAARYNPWGFEHGQTLTEAEASAVVLHQVNLQRSLIGLPALETSSDRSGAQCSVAAIVSTGVFRHFGECIPSNHYENIYGSFSSATAALEPAGAWTSSTTGHNEAQYSPTTTHAQVSVLCTANGDWNSEGYVAFQPVNSNGFTTARSSWANVPLLSQTDPLYAATGVVCDGATPRFRLASELRGVSPQLPEPALDPDAPELWYRFQIARLYSAYFDRAPDDGGWAYWNQRSVEGMNLWRTSDFFADSIEFKQTYGADLTNAEFLDLVYQNVLHRSPDAGGIAYWIDRMEDGLTRGQVMVFFSESPEYIDNVAPDITGSCWQSDIAAAYLCAAPSTVAPSG